MYVCVGDQWDSHEESEEGCSGATPPQRSSAHMYTHFDFISVYNHLVCSTCMYLCMYVNPIVYNGCIGSGRTRSSSSSLSPV